MKEMLVLGAGGHARAVIDVCLRQGIKVKACVDFEFKGQSESIFGIAVIGPEILYDWKGEVILAVGENNKRKEVFEANDSLNWVNVIDGSASISENANLGKGVFIGPRVVVVGGASIGDNVILNTSCTVDHETVIGNHCHVGPGVNISGRAKIGEGTFFGVGSSCVDQVVVGNNCLIGAGSTVLKDVEKGSRLVGNHRLL